jgi:hypothetical protein
LQDAAIKGRMQHGSKNPFAKLNTKQVKEIRQRRAAGETVKSLASSYNVWPSMISRIVNNHNWLRIAGGY